MLGDSGRERFGISLAICRCLLLRPSAPPLDQHFFDVGDRLSRIQPLRTGSRAVENGVASIEPERVFEAVEPLACCFIAAVDEPAICLEEHGRAKETIPVPP